MAVFRRMVDFFSGKKYQQEESPNPLTDKPWRKIHYPSDMKKTAEQLRGEIKEMEVKRLNIVMIGQSGAGKSTLINSILSVSRGRRVWKCFTQDDRKAGIGTVKYYRCQSNSEDLFREVHFCDTMGITESINTSDDGISEANLRALCEGRFLHGANLNKDTPEENPVPELKAHCVIFVVAAESIDQLNPSENSTISQKMNSLYKVVPVDVARIAVITKIDRVCEQTNSDISLIYRSKKVHSLVTKVKALFSVQENDIFPVVNLVTEMEMESSQSVPILYALKYAITFAQDVQEENY